MAKPSVTVDLPNVDIAVGCVFASGIDPEVASDCLDRPIEGLLEERRQPQLSQDQESIRLACRNMLRYGKYKPTGRGKPSSEYLLKTARTGNFPRISGLVDVCNLISLRWMVPISLADLDRMDSHLIHFRRGREGESYVFNKAGQILDLYDLIVGCATCDQGRTVPMLTPIKDSMAAKTNTNSRNIAAFLYFPTSVFDTDMMYLACNQYGQYLSHFGEGIFADILVVKANG